MEKGVIMDGWNLDEKKLKAEFDRKFPNYNQRRVCSICGHTFSSGKPRSVCLGCAKKNGLFQMAPKREIKPSWWTLKMVRIVSFIILSIALLTLGYSTGNMGASIFIIVISLVALLT